MPLPSGPPFLGRRCRSHPTGRKNRPAANTSDCRDSRTASHRAIHTVTDIRAAGAARRSEAPTARKTRPRRPLFAVRKTILRSGKRCTGIRRENLPPVFPADHIIEKALFPNRPAETTNDIPQTSPILRNPACGTFRPFVHGTFREAETFVRKFIYRPTLSKKRTVFSGLAKGNDEHSAQSRFLRIRPRYV